MADDNTLLIQSAYEAFGRGDIPGVLAILADDVIWNTPDILPQTVPISGKADVPSFFAKLSEAWDDFWLEIDDTCASGDRVCIIGRAGGTLDGGPADYGFVHAWTVRDGVAVRFDEYVDPSPALVNRAATAAA